MSKSIQDAFDLPVLEDLLKPQKEGEGANAEEEPEITDDMVDNFQDQEETNEGEMPVLNISTTPVSNRAMTTLEYEDRRDSKEYEKAMDNLHTETLEHAQDLMDLGYNVDTRSAGRIFENAANMYKIALDAQNSKRDAQLKARKLILEQKKLELMERASKGESDIPDSAKQNSSVVVEDRNALLKRLKAEALRDKIEKS